ncbi:cell wall inhibition responsive protein CwrA [Staphylococcus aureus]
MRIIRTVTIDILIIIGLDKKKQDYEKTNDTSSQLTDNKNDDKVIHLNNIKTLHAKEYNPSDFF